MKKENTKKASAKAAEDRAVPGTAEDINNEAEATAIAPTSVATEGVETPNATSEISEADLGDNHLAGASVVMVKTHDLKPNADSAKVYGDEVGEALEASIADEGIQTPLIVDRASGTVIDGSSRLKVATTLGIPFVPVIYVDDEKTNGLAMVASNVAREKTLEVKVREFIVYEEQEKKENKLRRKLKESVPPVGPSKSRDRAAEKVGLSATHLEKGREIVKIIDHLFDCGDADRAKRLRATLNKDSIKTAQELATDFGLIMPKAEATPVGKNEKNKKPEAAEGEAMEEVDRILVTEPVLNTTTASTAASHIAALKALAAWCGGDEASELCEEKKTALGDAFAAANKAMTDAGIISVTSLN
jgi:hypothetical protein